MINIENIIIKKTIYLLKKYNVKNIKNIKCKFINNNFGDYTILGIYTILHNNKEKNKIIKNIIYELNKYFCFYKVIYNNNFYINFYINYRWLEIVCNKLYFNNKIFENNYFAKNKNIKILIDYSSPNMIKEMHVGHLRSTIIGDSISRILNFLEFNVIKSNHIGDIGLNVALVITEVIEKNIKLNNINLNKLEIIYTNCFKKYSSNINFKIRTQYILFKLQNKSKDIMYIWKKIISKSIHMNNQLYKLLNIKLNNENIISESFCFKYLPFIIQDLYNKKILNNINNKKVIILNKFKNISNNDMGVIIQKENMIYTYIAIEISYIKYISDFIKANKIIYYIDNRQKDHIIYSHYICEIAKYIKKTYIEHHNIGIVLNSNNKPIKTKEGNTFKIKTLIKNINNKIKNTIKFSKYYNNNTLINKISKVMSINAIKYNELSKDRKKNYIFNENEIILNKKNTYIYIQYTYSRIYSIIKKNKINNIDRYKIKINHEYENKLLIYIMLFNTKILESSEGYPNILTNYLYDISLIFSKYYENINILKISDINIKYSSIKILKIILKIFYIISNLLGINFINKI